MALPIVLIGSGGHATVVIDLASVCDQPVAGVLALAGVTDLGELSTPVLGSDDRLKDREFLTAHRFIVAIGDNLFRHRLSRQILAAGGQLATLIHPFSFVSDKAVVGPGTVAMAGCVINAAAKIGTAVIVNTRASIDHHCSIGDGSHISCGATLGGTVNCGEEVWVGIGATISNNVSIGARTIIGAGSAVVRDIPADVVAYGVPARVVRRQNSQP
jgi:sugar O-acyltransferase (sialic acid O-acetyltransferase NeuD family)